jgi:8-oxo-dGTP diphosphatase
MSFYHVPRLTVDAVISSGGDKVVLIKRANPPFMGSWALPGGFVEYGETVEEACRREIKEECGIEIELQGILGVYSDPNRDPRGHTVSVVFLATYGNDDLRAGDDATQARLYTRDELKNLELAFDHRKVLMDAGWI